MKDRVRGYRQSPIKNANHEDALTNARSIRLAINTNGSSQRLTFGNFKPERNREPRVLYENDPSSLISLHKISPRLTRERLVKARPCHMHARTSESRPRPTPSKTKTRPTSPGEATFILAWTNAKRDRYTRSRAEWPRSFCMLYLEKP